MKLNTTPLLLTIKPNLLFFMQAQNPNLLKNFLNTDLLKIALNFINLNAWFKNIVKPLQSLKSSRVFKKSYQLSKSVNKCYSISSKPHNLSLYFIRSNLNRSVKVLNYVKLSPTTFKLFNLFSKLFSSLFIQSNIQWTYLSTYLQLISPQIRLQLVTPYYTSNILNYKNLFTLNLSSL